MNLHARTINHFIKPIFAKIIFGPQVFQSVHHKQQVFYDTLSTDLEKNLPKVFPAFNVRKL